MCPLSLHIHVMLVPHTCHQNAAYWSARAANAKLARETPAVTEAAATAVFDDAAVFVIVCVPAAGALVTVTPVTFSSSVAPAFFASAFNVVTKSAPPFFVRMVLRAVAPDLAAAAEAVLT